MIMRVPIIPHTYRLIDRISRLARLARKDRDLSSHEKKPGQQTLVEYNQECVIDVYGHCMRYGHVGHPCRTGS